VGSATGAPVPGGQPALRVLPVSGMAVFTLVPFLAAFRARLSAPRVSAPVLRILGASPDGAYVSPFGSVVGPLLRSAVWAISFRPFMAGDLARFSPSLRSGPSAALLLPSGPYL
jgi:hypothetical protein